MATTDEAIYQSNPNAPDDSAFERGALPHLMPGRDGRLLDPRRTPVRITGVDLERGYFGIAVLAFEDAGAQWLIPLESVGQYQFTPGPDAAPEAVAAMAAAAEALSQPLTVPAVPDARRRALDRLADERSQAGARLDQADVVGVDLEPFVQQRCGSPRICSVMDEYLRDRDLVDIESRFVETLVSNPGSGEVVKAHAIVLAELGLCPFVGTVVRDPELFSGRYSRQRISQHILTRMGFVQALFERVGPMPASLFRGIRVDRGDAVGPRRSSFVSASFSLDVAVAHFTAGPPATSAALLRQPVPRHRLFMTFVETAAMNGQYREAEAVLIGVSDDGSKGAREVF